jgi:gliding motility-associated-like protein
MNNRLLIIAFLLLPVILYGQPAELTYAGTIAKDGYARNKTYGPFNTGFNFTFYGNSFNQFYVNSNGRVTFGAGSISSVPTPIPTADTINNFIAPFWDDLVIDPSGNILYTTIGATPNRKCIIQFKNMGFYTNPVFMGTFSVILYETTNKIQIQYRLIVDNTSPRPQGSTAAIGIENATGTAGVEYSFKETDVVSSGLAISFTPSGPTYLMDPGATYDGVYLTKNLSQPDPGITVLRSPAQDAVIGQSHTFEWNEASNAISYKLYISNYFDLSEPTIYSVGAALSHSVTDLLLDTTYYWGVFATNLSGTSWCEIKRFQTNSSPPLAGLSRTVWVEQGDEIPGTIQYTGGDGSTVSATVTSLPAEGSLYQVTGGVKGALIDAVPVAVTDPGLQLIYVADGTTGTGVGTFNFYVTDDTGDSPEETITISVSPPGIPNVLFVARGAGLEIQLDRKMNNPAGKENQFTATVNGSPVAVSTAGLKPGDTTTIILSLATPLTGSETVTLAYTQGDVTTTLGGVLLSFDPTPVTLLSQTITFPEITPKKYGDPDYNPGASSTGGPVLYSSSDLLIATIVSNRVRFTGVGTLVITARHAGSATYAPAMYERPMTVNKGDQVITFNQPAARTYGDAPFNLTSTINSGLTVTYSSSNTSVATISGNTVTIHNAGSTTITASQAGSSLWNPATPVNRTLVVNKAGQTLTFDPVADRTYGDADFTLTATATSGLPVSFVTGNAAVATVTGNLVHITGGGTVTLTAVQAGNDNYNAATPVEQSFTVSKVTLTVTADNKTKPYLDPLPTLTFTVTGFVAGDGLSAINVLPAAATTADQNSDTGTYPITLTGGSDNSYDFTLVAGELTITPIAQVITFGDLPGSVVYGTPLTLIATSTSGLTVLFESMNSAIATVAGTQFTGVGSGTVQVRGYNAGNSNYLPGEAFITIEVTTTHKDVMYLFTPNGDGFNDLWEIPTLSELGRCDVRVFNRWGKQVYANSNYNNDWDGTSNGKPLPEGAYMFIIETELNGKIKGTVNIVR